MTVMLKMMISSTLTLTTLLMKQTWRTITCHLLLSHNLVVQAHKHRVLVQAHKHRALLQDHKHQLQVQCHEHRHRALDSLQCILLRAPRHTLSQGLEVVKVLGLILMPVVCLGALHGEEQRLGHNALTTQHFQAVHLQTGVRRGGGEALRQTLHSTEAVAEQLNCEILFHNGVALGSQPDIHWLPLVNHLSEILFNNEEALGSQRDIHWLPLVSHLSPEGALVSIHL